MDNLENYLEKSITNSHHQKTMLEYICNEIKFSCRRLENHNASKEIFQRDKALSSKDKEITVSIDLKEVDDLISKAQQLLHSDLSKPVKPSSRKSAQKTDESKSSSKKPSHSLSSASKRATDPMQRQKKIYTSNKRTQSNSIKKNIKRESITETLNKEIPKNYNFVSFNKDFLSAYRESKRYSNAFQATCKKYKPEAVKCQKQFLDALTNVGIDQKPCYIEKFEITEMIFAKFKLSSCDDYNLCFSNLKEWFVYQIELEIENQRLEFLTLYSKLLRDCLMRDGSSIKDYRLIYWQLSRTLPVLVTDEKLS